MKNNKIALITGGARGIGFGIAMEMAKAGFDLVLCGRKNQNEVESRLIELRNTGVQVIYSKCDISSESDRKKLIKDLKKVPGKINILVNNAGVAPRTRKDIMEITEEDFNWLLNINLTGPCFLTQEIARWMIELKKKNNTFDASIINVSSVSSSMASINRGEYCISKAGITMMTKLFATRLGEYNIPVYEIQPGIIATDMTSAVTEKYDKLFARGIAIQNRWGLPEDVGKAATALAQGYFPYSTGQVIMVDGGLTVSRL